MREIIKKLAYVHLVLGIIGSLVAAISFNRNWLLSIIIFVGAMLMVITLFVILMGLSEVLQNQAWIADQLEEKQSLSSSGGGEGPVRNASNSKADLLAAAARTDRVSGGSTWVCPDCGERNSTGSRICKGCGRDR